ncbi:MAG: 2-C-methyl-D-erythritol 2,4-cyclodiphosphate synthase [Candidatus Endonucleobacter sp. (ex Gigantidas childressi)]|nr:2-C-methyl-D-erythritol 2,4-cyclodiphosphate synthase [Candidatus Endonucleobacter sp. (ex Gigantidas childressi)]
MRIGHGFDVHRFGEGDHIIIGGVKIPFQYGLIAHSDGDVLIHAVCDALLGGAGLGDIGKHFPDTDERYSGINSRQLLRRVVSLLAEQRLKPYNIDATIIAQAPQMAPHINSMCLYLADDLGITRNQVNVKATTTEQLGYTGRKEGIAVHAVTLLHETG